MIGEPLDPIHANTTKNIKMVIKSDWPGILST